MEMKNVGVHWMKTAARPKENSGMTIHFRAVCMNLRKRLSFLRFPFHLPPDDLEAPAGRDEIRACKKRVFVQAALIMKRPTPLLKRNEVTL